jgi:hypothetical protein
VLTSGSPVDPEQIVAPDPWQAMGGASPVGPRKSLHTQSFLQQSGPLTNGMPHEKPLAHLVSKGLFGSRSSPPQSLSTLHSPEQVGPVSPAPLAPGWTAGFRQSSLGHSLAPVVNAPWLGPGFPESSQERPMAWSPPRSIQPQLKKSGHTRPVASQYPIIETVLFAMMNLSRG